MELHKENLLPQTFSEGSKKTPKSKKLKIFSEEPSSQDPDYCIEIEKLKARLKESEERTDEWKKKYKSQAETFRDNFDQYKQLKSENEKLRTEITELKNIEANRPKTSEPENTGKYMRTLLENKELRAQVEKMDNLTQEMMDFDKNQCKWNEKLWEVCQKLSQVNEKSKKEISALRQNSAGQDKVRSDMETTLEELKDKETSYLQQMETYHEKLKVLSFQNENFGQQNKNLMSRNETLSSTVQSLEEKLLTLQTELASKKEQIDEISTHLNESKKEVEQLRTVCAEMDIKMSNENFDHEQSLQNVQTELDFTKSRLNLMDREFENKIHHLNSLEKNLESLKQEKMEMKQIMQELSRERDMEKTKTTRSEENLNKIFKKYQELLAFKDVERIEDEAYIDELEQAIQQEKLRFVEAQKILLQQGELNIKNVFELDNSLAEVKKTLKASEMQNMEMKSLLESNHVVMQEMQQNLMLEKTKFEILNKEIVDFNESIGVQGNLDAPFTLTTQAFAQLEENQKEVVALLGELQKTLYEVELIHKDKEMQYESKLKDANDQVISLKGTFREVMEKEYVKSQNLMIQIEEMKNQMNEATKYREALETKLKEILTNFEALNDRYNACLSSLKKARHEILPSGTIPFDAQKLEKIVKKTLFLDKMIKAQNVEMAILQREKIEMMLRLEILALEKYGEHDDDLLAKYHVNQNKLFGLEQRNVMYSEEITLLNKEKQVLQAQLEKYSRESGEKLATLNDLYEKSQINVDWMNHVLDKVRILVERVKDPLGNEIKALLME